ncbi:MAG: glycosyltransferase family 4 protein [Solobacterium sp.]|nr:glycosyltransferase family 4 protein [Solobacterium sp.]
MKVIVANYRYFIAGGPEKYMFKFMEAARKRGIEVIPFSVSNPQNEESEYSNFFAKPRTRELMYSDTKKTVSNLIGMIRATTWNFDAERRLRNLIKTTKPDAVYILHEVNHLSPSIIRAAKKEGVRVVHRISDFFMLCPKYDFLCGDQICEACLNGRYSMALKNRCVKGSLFGTALRILGMKIYKWTRVFDDVDSYICTCEFSKNKLIAGGINDNKIFCVPTFIDGKAITPNYTHRKYFLFLGRLAHQKGARYAIEAMSYLKKTDYVLKITGKLTDSPEDKALQEYISTNNLNEKIEFVGFKSGAELDDLIRYSTSILCPAIWYENMPNTVIEAYAYGKPVIASRVGSLAEIVEDGKTGYLFEMKNAEDLADKMLRFVNNDALSGELGKMARQECLLKYNEDRHMEKVIALLKGVSL